MKTTTDKNKHLVTLGYNHLDPGHPDNPKAYRICGAHTTSENAKGEVCLHVAGYGTYHSGVGRCKFHGGSIPMRYGSALWRGRLKEHIKNISQDESNPLDLLPELEVQRVVLSLALDQLAGAPIQADVLVGTRKVGREGVEHDGDGNDDGDGVTVGGGGMVGFDGSVDVIDIPRVEFLPSGQPELSNKPHMRLVRAEDIEMVRELAGDVVNTVAKVVAMRNQTALTKAEVTYLLSSLREAIDMYVPRENREAFVRYLMDKMPLGSMNEAS